MDVLFIFVGMDIVVEQIEEEPWEFTVGLREDDENLGDYTITMDIEEYEKYGNEAEPAKVIKGTFLFLLDHEDPEMILDRFSLSQVEKYFPNYAQEVVEYI